MSPNVDPNLVAHHEAGHAVAMHELGWRIRLVSIRPEGDSGGRCVPESDLPIARCGLLWEVVGGGPGTPVPRKQHVDWQVKAAVYLAGPAAQAIFLDTRWLDESVKKDMVRAFEIAQAATRTDEDALQFDALASYWASQRMRRRWPVVDAFAGILFEQEELSGEDAHRIISAQLKRARRQVLGRRGRSLATRPN